MGERVWNPEAHPCWSPPQGLALFRPGALLPHKTGPRPTRAPWLEVTRWDKFLLNINISPSTINISRTSSENVLPVVNHTSLRQSEKVRKTHLNFSFYRRHYNQHYICILKILFLDFINSGPFSLAPGTLEGSTDQKEIALGLVFQQNISIQGGKKSPIMNTFKGKPHGAEITCLLLLLFLLIKQPLQRPI